MVTKAMQERDTAEKACLSFFPAGTIIQAEYGKSSWPYRGPCVSLIRIRAKEAVNPDHVEGL